MGGKIYMKRRNFSTTNYFIAFFMTVLIFVIGIFVGNYFNEMRMNDINGMTDNMQINLLSSDLETRLLEDTPCKFIINDSGSSAELFTIGAKLDYMESELGADNKDVLRLKEYYHLLEIRDYMILENYKSKCNTTITPILFFYSNKGDCDVCKDQGFVLDVLRKKHSNIDIYSFDVNIDNSALTAFKKINNVRTTPSIIMDGEIFEGFIDKSEIEERLSLI